MDTLPLRLELISSLLFQTFFRSCFSLIKQPIKSRSTDYFKANFPQKWNPNRLTFFVWRFKGQVLLILKKILFFIHQNLSIFSTIVITKKTNDDKKGNNVENVMKEEESEKDWKRDFQNKMLSHSHFVVTFLPFIIEEVIWQNNHTDAARPSIVFVIYSDVFSLLLKCRNGQKLFQNLLIYWSNF